MSFKKKLTAVALGGVLAATLTTSMTSMVYAGGEKTTITLWHAMGGVNGETVQALVDDFNASQDEIEVKAEYQGTYDDAITN